jgi:uncharacterized protein (DUF58 family)
MDAEGSELHDRVRRLLFASPALARAFARGDFRSVFRGRGIEFDSLREYYPDDDARLVDWSATARLGRPFIRTYREERSLTVFLAVDVSASMDQGSGELAKLDEAVLVSSLVAYAAQLRGLPVGCLLFARGILGSLPPRRGKAHALAVASLARGAFPTSGASKPRPERERGSERSSAGSKGGVEEIEGGRRGSELGLALRTVGKVLKRRSLVLVLSDFRAEAWRRPMAELARRHDVVAVRITDPSDLGPPGAGSFFAGDPETGEAAWLPLGSRAFRERWRSAGKARRKDFLDACSSAGVSSLEIDTSDDPALKLLDFFERRRPR